MKAYQMKIMLNDSHPPIWRRCVIPAGLTFSQLTVIFNIIMGWEGYHLSEFSFYKQAVDIFEDTEKFYSGSYLMGRRQEEPAVTCIDEYVEGEKSFTYTYDFGDDWRHKVTVEKILSDYDANYPVVLKYKGDCPPEDCGGIYGYQQMLAGEAEDEEAECVEYDSIAVNEELEETCFLQMNRIEKRTTAEIYKDFMEGEFGLFAKARKKSSAKKKNNAGNVVPKEVLALLREKIFQESAAMTQQYRDTNIREGLRFYAKEDLLLICGQWGLPVKKSQRKEKLLDLLSAHIVAPESLEKLFLCLSDQEMKSLKKAVKQNTLYRPDKADDFSTLYNAGAVFQLNSGEVEVPLEIADFFPLAEKPEFSSRRKRQAWIFSCVTAANILYGKTPLAIFYQLVRSKRNLHLQDEEILAYLQDVPGFRKDFIFYEDGILADELRPHIEDFKDLQKDAAYYVPSEAEILQLQTEPLITGKQDRQNIGRFLCDKAGLSLEQTQVILNKICGLFAYGMFPENVKDTLQQENIWPKLVFGQIDEFMHLLTTLGLHTRALIHRGFTPEEVMQSRQKTGDAYGKKTKKSASPKVVYMRDYQKER